MSVGPKTFSISNLSVHTGMDVALPLATIRSTPKSSVHVQYLAVWSEAMSRTSVFQKRATPLAAWIAFTAYKREVQVGTANRSGASLANLCSGGFASAKNGDLCT